ncbi:hypothetical protein Pla175_27880 [Pirellulimonas nuda]|uniref:PEP-CTERM protein-sorting domain-containing protein n=1 Tax=Pirellulimonas nuda TaxID=2528009 RepID=A0A518DD46_9BACT|nr:PEP-CTERM sorting domain-containing protein [Pirellulimonas nuda]QDU89398.1 hypothetical protein Pla175_27880 [Pirellulimonas nuda]
MKSTTVRLAPFVAALSLALSVVASGSTALAAVTVVTATSTGGNLTGRTLIDARMNPPIDTAPAYLPNNSDVRFVGEAGSTGTTAMPGTRMDRNSVFSFALPTLPVGQLITGVEFDITVSQVSRPDEMGRMVASLMGGVPVASDFLNSGIDPGPGNSLVGIYDSGLSGLGNSQVPANPDIVFSLSGAALTQFAGFYAGATPNRPDVYFRLSSEKAVDILSGNARYLLAFNDLDLDTLDTELRIYTTSVPEPASVVLLLAGAVGMLLVSRHLTGSPSALRRS